MFFCFFFYQKCFKRNLVLTWNHGKSHCKNLWHWKQNNVWGLMATVFCWHVPQKGKTFAKLTETQHQISSWEMEKKNCTEERRRRKRAEEEFKHGGRGHVSAQPRTHREEWGYSRSSGRLYEGLIAWDTAPLPPGAAQHSVAALLSFCRAWRAGWMRREGGRTREGGGPGG